MKNLLLITKMESEISSNKMEESLEVASSVVFAQNGVYLANDISRLMAEASKVERWSALDADIKARNVEPATIDTITYEQLVEMIETHDKVIVL